MTTFSYNTADANPILDAGIYDAVILEAKTGETKKGDPKLQVCVKVYGPDKISPLVVDHIMAPYGIRRLKQLCEATGVDFDGGSVDPADLIGSNVCVKLRIRSDESGEYEDQNDIVAYYPDGRAPRPDQAVAGAPPTDATATPRASSTPPTTDSCEATAFAAFAAAVRADRPDAAETQLKSEFIRICADLVSDKKRTEFTAEDWRQVTTDGPASYIPF